MPPRVTQTIQETQEFIDDGQPLDASYLGQERAVEKESGQLACAPRASQPDLSRPATLGDFVTLNAGMQNMLNIQQQQLALMQYLSNRLDRFDTYAGSYAAGTTVERATWWALWGLLMLILGGTLVTLILLIVTQNLGVGR